jgi:hypothetical protein
MKDEILYNLFLNCFFRDYSLFKMPIENELDYDIFKCNCFLQMLKDCFPENEQTCTKIKVVHKQSLIETLIDCRLFNYIAE